MIQNVTLQAGPDAGQLVGLHLLIPRILGSAAGHMAYSGYLGYFIGLSALKPSKRWPIFGVGYFSTSALHALLNASVAEGRTFRDVGGSFVLCVFGSGDLTGPELCLQIERKILPRE
ncbi:PrsW family glutamic-type intramembrane protease [Microcoleus sp. herbarium2]|uniref:PrsW family glutamic-type intramembrane protease n=1 Tax=Microcoleus sp. herbarium2 TaxID=3055433 RepID=UPI002FD3AF3C